MDRKMFFAIRKRIRKLASENGEAEKDIIIKITLVNGTDLHVKFGNCELMDDDFVEIQTGQSFGYKFCFVPVKNILTISI